MTTDKSETPNCTTCNDEGYLYDDNWEVISKCSDCHDKNNVGIKLKAMHQCCFEDDYNPIIEMCKSCEEEFHKTRMKGFPYLGKEDKNV